MKYDKSTVNESAGVNVLSGYLRCWDGEPVKFSPVFFSVSVDLKGLRNCSKNKLSGLVLTDRAGFLLDSVSILILTVSGTEHSEVII
jgi:hypothetical protein